MARSKQPEVSISNFIYNIPADGKGVGKPVVKRGRGRPRKRVSCDGLTVHQEPTKSSHKPLTSQDRYKIRRRYDAYLALNPTAGIQRLVTEVAKEFELTYAQTHEIIKP